MSAIEPVIRPDEGSGRAWLAWPLTVFGVGLSLAHIWFNTLATIQENYVAAFHFAGLAALAFCLKPAWRGRSSLGLDLALAALAIGCAVYLVLFESALYARGVTFIWSDWLFSTAAVLLAIEAARRTTGWTVPILVVVFVTYVAVWGRFVPGVLNFPGLSWEIVLYRAFFTTDESLFGLTARISATYVYMFVLFGAFLVRSGAGDFIVDLARAAAGRIVGGPGLVAVIGSGLMGTISGSAVGNVVTTGVITIPLMKRAGFPPRFAAGVEAAASTGGQLMPPIMGAGAFVMASYTGIPYLTIAAVSFLPAVLYFLSVAYWVRITAKKRNLSVLEEETEPVGRILRRGIHFLIPLGVLIGLLVVGYTPTYAAGASMVAVIASSWLSPQPEHRMGPAAVIEALALGARNMVPTGLLLVAVGLVVSAVATTGLGNTFSLMVIDWSGGNLLVLILLVAIASLVVGMGLPVTAAYIVLATLSAPALYNLIAADHVADLITAGTLPEAAKALFLLVDPAASTRLAAPMPAAEAQALVAAVPSNILGQLVDLGLTPALVTTTLLSAHMIIFWLSQDSNVTPPVCLAAFAAAGLAGTPPMATGLTAWAIAKGLYIVPLLFAFTPFLAGAFDAVAIFLFAAFGLYGLTAAISGHMETPLGWLGRAVALAAGAALLWPTGNLVNAAGLLVLLAQIVLNVRAAR